MRTGKIRTLWLGLRCCLQIAGMATQAIYKNWNHTLTRQWIDQRMQRWVQSVLNLLDIKYRVVNPQHVELKPGQVTIIMCNHSSLFDIPLSYLAFPKCSLRMLAKKEMAKIPLMGRAMVAAEYPFVDRKNRTQAIKDLENVHDLLESGIVMWIAPEGTRAHNGKLASFKKGGFITAIQAQATIIPIGIRGAYNILPARTLELHIGQEVEIHIGQPVDASQYTLENKEALIANVHDEMLRLVGEKA